MVTNLLLTEQHKIGVASDKFMLEGKKNSIKDVPFVRYRFKSYTAEDVEYIKVMMGKFKYSSHIVEIELIENTHEWVAYIKSQLNVAVLVYTGVDDNTVVDGFSEEKKASIEKLASMKDYIDRFMLKDESTSLNLVLANVLRGSVKKLTGLHINKIGICSSYLSFDGEACLTAIRCRELQAKYMGEPGVAVPSANHQNMSTCGCVRHAIITEDSAAPEKSASKSGTTEKKKKDTSKKVKVEKSEAQVKTKVIKAPRMIP